MDGEGAAGQVQAAAAAVERAPVVDPYHDGLAVGRVDHPDQRVERQGLVGRGQLGRVEPLAAGRRLALVVVRRLAAPRSLTTAAMASGADGAAAAMPLAVRSWVSVAVARSAWALRSGGGMSAGSYVEREIGVSC